MLFGKNFDEIDATSMQSLITAGATESVHLEFKRATYGSADSDKIEFLKDISSFANTLGGHLIIGMDEEEGAASGLVPIQDLSIDDELQRLESIARSCIEPRVVGLRMRRIDVVGGNLIIIYVPRSFNPPHRVIYKNTNRYHGRNSAGVHELSIEELRMLFGQQRSIEEQAKAFIGQRFLRIQGNDGPIPLNIADGALVMHLVPLLSFGSKRRIEIAELEAERLNFRPIRSVSSTSWRINLDGYCIYEAGPDCQGYTQIFRDGSFEATKANFRFAHDGRLVISSEEITDDLIQCLNQYMKILKKFETSPPMLLQISAMEVDGLEIAIPRMPMFEHPPAYRGDALHLPPSLITNFRDDENYEAVIAEQMDFLWNAFGFARCSYFNQNGNRLKG